MLKWWSYIEGLLWDPVAQFLLVTRARISRGIPYVSCMCPLVVFGPQLLWTFCVGLCPSSTGCKILQAHWYAGLAPWSGSHFGGVPVLAGATIGWGRVRTTFKGPADLGGLSRAGPQEHLGQNAWCMLDWIKSDRNGTCQCKGRKVKRKNTGIFQCFCSQREFQQISAIWHTHPN